MKRLTLLCGLALWGSAAQALSVKLRPQGAALTQAVREVVGELSTRDLPITLDTSGGPTLTLGGVGVSAAPFNPDVQVRVVSVGGERRIELRPDLSGAALKAALRSELGRELGIKTWNPAGAAARFGGADLNNDGAVDLADLALIMENMGKENATVGDLDGDRRVDEADLKLFSRQYSLP